MNKNKLFKNYKDSFPIIKKALLNSEILKMMP